MELNQSSTRIILISGKCEGMESDIANLSLSNERLLSALMELEAESFTKVCDIF